MIIVYVVIGFIVLILLIAAFVGTGWTYEKSIPIKAPLDKVWNQVNTLKASAEWSPWIEKDPYMKQEYKGEDGKPGAKYSWNSNDKNVGAGVQTIVGVINKSEFVTRIDFIRPFKGTGQGYVRINKENGATNVIWGIKSSTPYPMNIIKIFGVIEKNLDKDFEVGLSKLRALCEH